MLKSRVLMSVLSLAVGVTLAGDRSVAQSTQFELVPIPASLAHHHGTVAAPRIRGFHKGKTIQESTSLNWSGYALQTNLTNPATGAVSDVKGSWVVPSVLRDAASTAYSSAWVGIDGYSDGTVEQLGTEQDWYKGRPSYYAWIEMYPGGSYLIRGFPVNPGDKITAEVKAQSSTSFALTLTNYTRGVRFTTVQRMTGAELSSAEWVMEAPSYNSVLPLADFGTINFSECSAVVNGVACAINDPALQYDEMVMETSGGVVKAQPSALNASGNAFSVTWRHY